MTEGPSSNDKEQQGKRKASGTPHLGNFGFKLKKNIKGKEFTAEISDGRPMQRHKCEDCKRCFNTTQGLSGHRVHCQVAKASTAVRVTKEQACMGDMKDYTDIVLEKKAKHVPKKHPTSAKGAIMINRTSSTSASQSQKEGDGRKSNRGSTVRKQYTNLQKARIIELFERTSENMTVAEWVHENKVGREFEKYLGKSKTGWRNDINKKLIMEKAADDRYKNVKYSTSGNRYKKSPYHASEVELFKKIYEHRKNGRKVSKYFIKTTAKMCVQQYQPGSMAKNFKASNGWFYLFCKRRNICFRKRKSGKKYCGEDNLIKIIKVSVLICPYITLTLTLTLFCLVFIIF